MSYDIDMPVVPFRVDSDIKELLKYIANKRDTSVQLVVREIIIKYLEEKGYLIIGRTINMKD